MPNQETLQTLKNEIAELLQEYEQTKDQDVLAKANVLRIKYAELDVKLNNKKAPN